ncbi:MAG: ABC transporter ATP-binding protein [Candidatus Bathyarchaeia archaeon]
MTDSLITVKNVSRKFSIRKGLRSIEFYALKDIDLEIPRSSIVGLVGESGSGKTTLGKITLALLKPTRGEVLYEGKDIFRLAKKKEYRRLFQYIPQDPYASLNPFKTVKQLLMEPILYHKLARNKHEAMEIIHELMTNVGLTPPERYLNFYPPQLSGGERQRINIARALVVKPTYVVADEPTTMLDASLKSGIMSTLRDSITKTNISLVFITHEISLMQFFGPSPTVTVMYLGKIVEQGALKDLLSEPLHPYTKALIHAMPVADPKYRNERSILLKEAPPPSPINRPPGCPLSDRCPFAFDLCSKEEPVLKNSGATRRVACHLY